MSRDILNIVASYDISDHRRLAKVANVMKDYGKRVLKSVFECNLRKEVFLKMKERIDNIIDPIDDTVRYYILCEKCIKGIEYSGRGELFQENEDYKIV